MCVIKTVLLNVLYFLTSDDVPEVNGIIVLNCHHCIIEAKYRNVPRPLVTVFEIMKVATDKDRFTRFTI